MANTDLTIVSQTELTGEGKDIIPDVTLRLDHTRSIPFTEIVKALRERSYDVANAVFTYYSKELKAFVYSGKYNSVESYSVPLDDAYPTLQLKIRNPTGNSFTQSVSQEKKPVGKKEHAKRNKERRIGDIIEKVNEWRTLYTGTTDSTGTFLKFSLEKAAEKVGIAKKTLDDYLLQLRAGKKYGFDFQAYKDSKVGALRAFVKEQKKREKAQMQSSSDQDCVHEVEAQGNERENMLQG
eukprot:TRINITY_DN859_c0_g1_i9.p2 TRINITY_DN859_c0_g1~~TRINITY_DN859_c0_g1_i9.p2  ORF type:complete len:238 (-),score=68.81 TRINITY_DN859_c0_g1_i9:178-891(-)